MLDNIKLKGILGYKLIISVMIVGSYLILMIFGVFFSINIFPFSFLPVTVIAWFYGYKAGITTTVVISFFNYLFFIIVMGRGFGEIFNNPALNGGTFSIILMAIFVGISGQYYYRMRDRVQLLEVTENKLKNALHRTEVIYHATSSLVSMDNLSDLLQIIVDGVVEALEASRVLLLTVDQKKKRVIDFVVGGPDKHLSDKLTYEEICQGLSGWVFRERKPALSPGGIIDKRESKKVRLRRKRNNCGSIIVIPLVCRGEILGTMTAIRRPEDEDFTWNDVELLTAMGSQAAVAIENARLFVSRKKSEEELKKLATRDFLTNVYNRRTGLMMLEEEMEKSRIKGLPLTICFIDNNDLKEVNDTYGHGEGDKVIIAICKILKKTLRDIDIICRMGGDEFLLIFPGCTIEEAELIWYRLEYSIKQYNLKNNKPYKVSVSYGFAEYNPEDNIDIIEFVAIADRRMYQQKRRFKEIKA